MSSKDHKRKLGDLVSAWIGPWKAVGPQHVIAMIVHDTGKEYTVDILHVSGVTSVWRVNLKDLQDNEAIEAINALYQNAKVEDR